MTIEGGKEASLVEQLDLDALEAVARAAQGVGAWRAEPILNYQDDRELVGAAIVTDSFMVAEVRGAVKVGGRRWGTNANTADFIAAFDPPTIQALIARVRAAEAQASTYREALTRLRDCDWTIGRGDRMDAVREIARQALQGDADVGRGGGG